MSEVTINEYIEDGKLVLDPQRFCSPRRPLNKRPRERDEMNVGQQWVSTTIQSFLTEEVFGNDNPVTQKLASVWVHHWLKW